MAAHGKHIGPGEACALCLSRCVALSLFVLSFFVSVPVFWLEGIEGLLSHCLSPSVAMFISFCRHVTADGSSQPACLLRVGYYSRCGALHFAFWQPTGAMWHSGCRPWSDRRGLVLVTEPRKRTASFQGQEPLRVRGCGC